MWVVVILGVLILVGGFLMFAYAGGVARYLAGQRSRMIFIRDELPRKENPVTIFRWLGLLIVGIGGGFLFVSVVKPML